MGQDNLDKTFLLAGIIVGTSFLLVSMATAADKVVVVPLFSGAKMLAPVEKTGQTVSYASKDDGDYEEGINRTPRWEIRSEESYGIRDRLTGLIWQNPLGGTLSAWGGLPGPDGLDYCEELVTGGQYSDWRMPNVKELQSLIDFGQAGPALPTDHPFSIVSSEEYWTSTTWKNSTNQAWTVNLDSGLTQPENKINSNRIWCVRGPYR